MQLTIAEAEPESASRGKGSWLGNFAEPKQVAVVRASDGLTPNRDGYLYVIQRLDGQVGHRLILSEHRASSPRRFIRSRASTRPAQSLGVPFSNRYWSEYASMGRQAHARFLSPYVPSMRLTGGQ